VVVPFAPQRELLARAALTITHAGLNTTLESLSAGVPLVAIPITFEQPAIAARIRWTGVGESAPASGLNPQRLRGLIQRVLRESGYKAAAERMKQVLARTGGSLQAADIAEEVVRTRKPVVSRIPEFPNP
jgi:UDP:flavonoid glycosyltransferase YjiC (YdhE family)